MLNQSFSDFLVELNSINPELAKRYANMLAALEHIVKMRERINNILKESQL